MGLLSNKISRDELKPGDHIYSWRQAYIYAHHGIYVGEGKVIHFTQGEGQEIGTGTSLDRVILSSSPLHPLGIACPDCGDQSRLAGVICSCLDCFLSGGDIYLFKYGVSSVYFLATRGGTCTVATADSQESVLHRARFLLENGFGAYHVSKKNCEDFAIYCKTSRILATSLMGVSGQATSFYAGFGAFACSQIKYLTLGSGGLSAVGYGVYYGVTRLCSDIGVRKSLSNAVSAFASSGLRYLTLGSGVVSAVFGYGVSYSVGRLCSDIGLRKDAVIVPVESLIPHSVTQDGTCSKTDGGSSSSSSSSSKSVCIICFEASVEAACIPCGHVAGCLSCLNEVKARQGLCPVCRAEINQVTKLYAV